MKKLFAIVVTLCLIAGVLCACSQPSDVVDYSNSENWAYYAVGENKNADLFLICSTVDMGKDGNYNMSMDDAEPRRALSAR